MYDEIAIVLRAQTPNHSFVWREWAPKIVSVIDWDGEKVDELAVDTEPTTEMLRNMAAAWTHEWLHCDDCTGCGELPFDCVCD